MHNSVMTYVKRLVDAHDLSRKSVLDVGGMNVNGTVRVHFCGPFVSTDMRPGEGVDEVVNAHALLDRFGTDKFDVVVSCEMLEHDDEPWSSMKNMGAVLKPGGRLIFTTRGIGYAKHDHPSDYYRYTREGGIKLAELAGLCDIEAEDDPEVSGIFVTGVKPW